MNRIWKNTKQMIHRPLHLYETTSEIRKFVKQIELELIRLADFGRSTKLVPLNSKITRKHMVDKRVAELFKNAERRRHMQERMAGL